MALKTVQPSVVNLNVYLTLDATKVAPTPDPVLCEMLQAAPSNVGNVLLRFDDLMAAIRKFCDERADETIQSMQPSSFDKFHEPDTSLSRLVLRSASEFSSPADYAYFALLSIVNRHFCERLFNPFHPCATPGENKDYGDTYTHLSTTGESDASVMLRTGRC